MTFKYLLLICSLPIALTGCVNHKATQHNVIFGKPDYKQAAELNVQMGQEYFRLGQYSRAKSKLLHAIKLQPKSPNAHTALAIFYENINEYELSSKHHKLAIAYGKKQGVYHNNYGNFLTRRKNYTKAQQQFLIALNDPELVDTAAIYHNLGSCLLEAKEYDKAVHYLTKSLNHDPRHVHVKIELATAEYFRGNYQRALKLATDYQNQVQLTPKSLLLLIKLKHALNQPKDAAVDLMKLRNLFPDSAELITYNTTIKPTLQVNNHE